MNKKKLAQVLFLVLFIFNGISAQYKPLNCLTKETFDISQNKIKIDKKLIKYIKCNLYIKFDIVNPNRKYNSTDVIFYPSKPSRSLIFAGCNVEKNMGFIFYKSGFIGKPYLCLVYKKNNKDYNLMLLGINPSVNNFEALQNEIKNKKYSIMSKESM